MYLQKKTARLFICCSISIAILYACKYDTKQEYKTDTLTKDSLPAKEKTNPYITNDKSPLDISYYPQEYPVLRMNGTDSGKLVCRVIYSRPQKNGRIIFGNADKSLCLYGKEWRLGANEATEIEFFRQVNINGNIINKGRYVIYCIPFPEKWTIVINSNLYTWGLHMDPAKDIFKTDVPVTQQFPPLEDFTMVFKPASYGADLLMAWDNVKTVLPISFSK